jgi:hypothetical protein
VLSLILTESWARCKGVRIPSMFWLESVVSAAAVVVIRRGRGAACRWRGVVVAGRWFASILSAHQAVVYFHYLMNSSQASILAIA